MFRHQTSILKYGSILLALVTLASYYPAYKYVAGYFDMTEWANPHTVSNMTVGLVSLFLAFGAVLGYFIPKTVLRRLPPKRRGLATMFITLVLTLAFCLFLSIAGVPGFRFT